MNTDWYKGVAISVIGLLVGSIAFALFCAALGLNFQDEGWSDDRNAWQSNRATLTGSLVGMAVAILMFWIGFVQMTRSQREKND